MQQHEANALETVLIMAAALYAIGFFVSFMGILFHNANTVLNDKPKVSPATCFFSILFILWPNTFHIKEKEEED